MYMGTQVRYYDNQIMISNRDNSLHSEQTLRGRVGDGVKEDSNYKKPDVQNYCLCTQLLDSLCHASYVCHVSNHSNDIYKASSFLAFIYRRADGATDGWLDRQDTCKEYSSIEE